MHLHNNSNIQLSTRFRLDKQDASLRHMENSVYLRRKRSYLNFGHIWDSSPVDIYSKTDEDTNEARAGIGLQLTNRLNIREQVIYNIYEHVIQQHSGGIYYDHPCYYLSLEYKHDNAVRKDYVGGTTFQFKFGISIDGKHY